MRLAEPTHAKFPLTVEDACQHLGIGGHLRRKWVAFDRQAGRETFEAEIQVENRGKLRLNRDIGFRPRSRITGGVCHVAFPITEAEPAEEI